MSCRSLRRNLDLEAAAGLLAIALLAVEPRTASAAPSATDPGGAPEALGASSTRDARAELPDARRPGSAGLERRVGAQVPLAAHFRASDGRDVTLGDVLHGGKPALLALAYNRCTMLCSLVLRRMAELVPQLGLRPEDDYSLLTVSIDPSDTVFEAARLQTALLDRAGFAGEPHRWEFLVGQRRDIDLLADALGFRYAWDPATAQYDHPAVLFTLSPDGRVSGYFDGLAPDPAALRSALQRPGSTFAAASVEDIILECFRFDTTHSRYGTLIAWLLRAGGASIALALGALLWRLGRPPRRQGAQP